MKLNLAIDQGNTAAKVSLFIGTQLVSTTRHEELHPDYVKYLIESNEIESAIYSTVCKKDDEVESVMKECLTHFINLSASTPSPLTIDYATPNSLGHDRIASAVGAMSEMPGKNILIIDAGTAITLDTVTKDGHFKGGNITPGLSTRFGSLHNFTDKLPLIDKDGDIPLIGYDTTTAIRSGVITGLIAEISGYIELITHEMGDLTVFMTGGDSHFLAERIKSPIFDDENLLAKGLNRILLYNENI